MEGNELRNPYAELHSPDSGVLVTAQDSGWGEFYCPHPNCIDPARKLFKKRSKNGRPFFSHYGEYEHPISYETLLHKTAIRHFKELLEFELPRFNGIVESIKLNPAETVLEYNGLKKIKPDVRVMSESGKEYWIEIFVTHETKGKKLPIICQYDIPTIEIDLSWFYRTNTELCKYDLVFINSKIKELISDIRLKKWLYPLEVISVEQPTLLIQKPPENEEPKQQPQIAKGSLTTSDKVAIGATLAGVVLMIFPSLRKWVGGLFGFRTISRSNRRRKM
jgi:hypothetical protein